MVMAVEDHGAGTQLVRIRAWPRLSHVSLFPASILTGLVLLAGLDGEWILGSCFAALLIGLLCKSVQQAGEAMAMLLKARSRTDAQSDL
jgi:hypothetical protein